MDEVLPEIQWLSSPEDLWNLLNLNKHELLIIYPDRDWDSLRRRKNKIKRKGYKIMPSNPEYENPETERERANARRKRVAPKAGQTALSSFITPEQRAKLHNQLDKAIDEYGANIGKVTFTEWEMGFTTGGGDDKVGDKIPLNSTRVEVRFDTEPQWPIVQPAESQIRLPKIEVNKEPSDREVWMILPDNQIHYWMTEEGEFIPFHDIEAHALALQIMQDYAKDVHGVINLGDFLDAPTFQPKYIQTPTFAMTQNRAIQFGHNFLAAQRNILKDRPIHLLRGNHTDRLDKYSKTNAQAAWGVKQAGETWPVLSEPFLLKLGDLQVDYLDGYTDAGYGLWLTDNLIVTHAPLRRQHFHEKVNNIHGHLHKEYVEKQTINNHDGGEIRFTASPGTLARIDGFVPSTNGSMSSHGIPNKRMENWQQSIGWLEIDRKTGALHYQNISIDTLREHTALFNGKTYRPDPKLVEQMKGWDRRG